MAGVLFALVAIALVVTVLRARTSVVLGVFAVSILLLPAPLLVPYTGASSGASYLTFQHVLTLAGLARVVLGRLDGSVPRRHLTPTNAQAALLVLVAVAFVGGIVFSPDAGALGFGSHRFADLLDQLAWCVVVLVLAREVGALTTLTAAAVGLAVGVGLAFIEHTTSFSWGELLFRPFPQGNQLAAAAPLEARNGELRVRAGVEYALEFGWVVVVMAPALVVVALRRVGVWLAGLAGFACVLAVYWSYSRSALAAVVVVVLLAALLSGNRALALLGAAATVPATLAYAALPAVRAHLSASSGEGSLAVRGQRVAPAMEVASHHPVRGTGLGQLVTSGFAATDQAFLLQYVELGVLGVVALVLVLVAALQLCARAALTAPSADRALAVAGGLGAAAFVVSCFAYDAATLLQGLHAFWLMVAAAAALVPVRTWSAQVGRRVLRGLAAGLVGFLVGLAVYAQAPEHTAVRAYFTTLPQKSETWYPLDPLTSARPLVGTVCGTLTTAALEGVKVDCTDTFGAAGVGFLRVEARTAYEASAALRELTRRASEEGGVRHLSVLPLDPPRTGRDSWARTAPVWCALGVAGLTALLWPARRRRRSVDWPSAAVLPVLVTAR